MTQSLTPFTTDDALYGLRNLAVGDDEQTRIADYDLDVLTPDARACVERDDYEGAYVAQIRATLAHLTREQVADLADTWAIAFCSPDCDDDENDDAERPEDLADDMMNVYDDMIAR